MKPIEEGCLVLIIGSATNPNVGRSCTAIRNLGTEYETRVGRIESADGSNMWETDLDRDPFDHHYELPFNVQCESSLMRIDGETEEEKDFTMEEIKL